MSRRIFPSLIALALAACGKPENNSPVDAGPPPCDDKPGVICTWGGTGEAGFDGDGHKPEASMFYWPVDVEFDKANTPYVLDYNNHRIRRTKADGTFETVVGTDLPGDGDPAFADSKTPAGAAGTTVALNHPTGLTFQPDGLIVIAAWHNHKIRTLDPNTGMVKVISGSKYGYEGDGGAAKDAKLNQPSKVAIDAKGQIFILDQRNQRVRRIGTDATHTITSPVGTGVAGFAGDGNAPVDAKLSFEAGPSPEPNGALAFDGQGLLYIADTQNHRIRVVDLAKNTINTLAGTGEAGYEGDGGEATKAKLNAPRDLAIGPDGRLYVADTNNNVVRAIALDGTHTISTVAGTGAAGFSGDGAEATKAQLNRPFGLSFDQRGALYVSDTYNHRIRRIGR